MAILFHVSKYRPGNHSLRYVCLCGQKADFLYHSLQYLGTKRDQRYRWCKKCVELEPLAALAEIEL